MDEMKEALPVSGFNMSYIMRKLFLCHMQTTKTQISLHIHAVWSTSLLFTP